MKLNQLITVEEYLEYFKNYIVTDAVENYNTLINNFEYHISYNELIKGILEQGELYILSENFRKTYNMSELAYKHYIQLYDLEIEEDVLEIEDFINHIYNELTLFIIKKAMKKLNINPKIKTDEKFNY